MLLGVIVSGFIQTFLTERWITRIMPRNRLLSTLLGCGIGFFFPSCECGIVPITRRLIGKGVPLNAGIAFMLTGPIINPIVMFSTYVAFGNDWRMAAIRAGGAVVVAFIVSTVLSLIFVRLPVREKVSTLDTNELLDVVVSSRSAISPLQARPSFRGRVYEVMLHAIEEFFSVGKYLVIGAFIAASMQTFVPTSALIHLGSSPLTSILVMITLAFVMSLCSEADAFIASSFRSTFSTGAISSFLIFGPMIDIKNTLMLLGAFKGKFVFTLITLVTITTVLVSLLVGRLFG